MEGDVETTIREYNTKVDRPLTSNRNMIMPSYSYKLIDRIHIHYEVLLISKYVSCSATVEEYSSSRE